MLRERSKIEKEQIKLGNRSVDLANVLNVFLLACFETTKKRSNNKKFE